jgi:ABC-type uncharacterized transport system involved in gliding motility auxiliary subunit
MNNPNLRRFAVLGLYLAGLAVLASAVLYIIEGRITLPLQISLAVIVLGLALFVFMDPQRAREALTGRQARYGSNALLMTIAFLGIVGVVNYLVGQNTRQWDLTEDKQNTLAEETINTIASLNAPVQAEAFYTARMPVETTRSLLQNYQTHSKGKFQFEIIDPETDPIRAQQASITRDGTIVLRMEDRQELVSFASEEALTAALVRLSNPGERAVYFLTGHGEYSLDATSEGNYSSVSAALTAKNYAVNTLNLLANPSVPEDALALIVAGPTKPVSVEEVQVIKTYLEQGGSLVYLAEPRPLTEFGQQADPLAEYLQTDWGIVLDETIIFDLSSNRQFIAISDNRFADHPITRNMYSQVIVLPTARSLSFGAAPEGRQVTELAFTSEKAWGETNYQSLEQGQVIPEEGQDVLGPLTLAAAGVDSHLGGRVLVIGDSDFAASSSFDQYGNSDFIINGIDWAAEQESLISLTARQPVQRFIVPPQSTSMGLLLLGSIFALPGVVILTGISVWAQRRRRG